ncbi:MAG TPA: histidinol-phosphatase HisJ family protein [Mariprofundaceae bacterium]|nr:histidinol-phosphatase HisJ family protein [Mariprofundaceae bacterium]
MRFAPVPDYHMHTPRCHHAIGSIRDYAAVAVQLGLSEIGMSDHSPMPNGFDAAWRMQDDELAGYLDELEQTRERFAGRLAIRRGLEADYHPGSEAYVADMIASHPWDYIIGSVHYIGDWGFDNPDNMEQWQGRDLDDAYCAYFETVAASARTGMFDIIGHPDLIKKFGHRPTPGSRRVAETMEAMLQAVKEAGAALEISSAGLRKPVGEVYPHGAMIARAAELKIPFAFGSDAHAPGEVGHAMDTCLAMLTACGVQEVAAFEQRRMRLLPITPL